MIARLASLYTAVDIRQPFGPLLIGERANATGSKKFRELLLADDFDSMVGVLQAQAGAHVLDVSVAYAGRDELADMQKFVRMAVTAVTQPLMIDSTNPAVIETALKYYPGRPVINSVNLEDGGETLAKIAPLAKEYGAMLVALTIDEKGMALTCERKLAVALRLRDLLVEHGLRDQDMMFDCLTFTVGSGDESLYTAGIETLDAIKKLKRMLPDCHTVLGLSNISFGLKPNCRHVVNSVFLQEAVNAGLTAAIVDAAKIQPLSEIDAKEKELALALIYNDRADGNDPLINIINHFAEAASDNTQVAVGITQLPEEMLAQKIIKGNKDGLEDVLAALLERYGAPEIINTLLIPTMQKIGEQFGQGQMLLPFVLQAAETMRQAVNLLEPYMPKSEIQARKKVLLATVQGDVHDIGKNLVDIILSNNGYEVVNIGIKQTAEQIMNQARAHDVDMIGLSGLLVKSALIMKESLPQYQAAGLDIPVLLGGAALTPRFVAEECAPLYQKPVVYCQDAFDALKALDDLERNRLVSTVTEKDDFVVIAPVNSSAIGDAPALTPPFSGPRTLNDFALKEVLGNLNKQALFRNRWSYHQGGMTDAEYQKLLRETVEPQFVSLLAKLEPVLDFQAVYGYFNGQANGETLTITAGKQAHAFTFPRQKLPNGLCLTDFFKTTDAAAATPLFAVTLGAKTAAYVKQAFDKNDYSHYLLLHGLAAELTDALAQTLQKRVAAELKLGKLTGNPAFMGVRYGFGYPACPDLELNRPLFEILNAEQLGLRLTESFMIEPEYSTCGLIACHPAARYFSI